MYSKIYGSECQGLMSCLGEQTMKALMLGM